MFWSKKFFNYKYMLKPHSPSLLPLSISLSLSLFSLSLSLSQNVFWANIKRLWMFRIQYTIHNNFYIMISHHKYNRLLDSYLSSDAILVSVLRSVANFQNIENITKCDHGTYPENVVLSSVFLLFISLMKT